MKWISVKERPPDSDKDVLVTDGVNVYEGWYDHSAKEWLIWIPHRNSVYFINVNDVWPNPDKSITHWSDDYNLPS